MTAIINYTIRGLIVIVGLLILFGGIVLPQVDAKANTVFGIVFILFGLYRIAMYYTAQKRLEREQEEE